MAGNGAVHHAGIEFLQVQTMTDSRAEAMELARAAVEARLAAGTQVAGPLASTFWWNEEIERVEEWLVFFKTTADRVEQLITFIADRHSYDEPEIVAVPIVAGATAYLDWLRDETRPEDGDETAEVADEGSAGGLLGGVPPQVTPEAERSTSA
ncbi:MAG TPA: divalent-cation tolerance protein CutA [Trebonia sp.]|jgi:periplasmic divalent cation tolerance protein|nr:divalent-cation tolerance protein CutA [Trebonia sp.]